ncbi:hypothetical protein [Niveibacterium sp. SC-1]|uniref:hypothetical protein n=1 Tax=Niveibacterium sp. SC-1 TaxID=3135646 RepID=UPI00311F5AE9
MSPEERWFFVLFAALLCIGLVALFQFDATGPIKCNLEKGSRLTVTGMLAVEVTNHYNSTNYTVGLLQQDKFVEGVISCNPSGICGWLGELQPWPQRARLVLVECRPKDGARLYAIAEAQVGEHVRTFEQSVQHQRSTSKLLANTFICAFALAVLASLMIWRGLVKRKNRCRD